MHLQGHSGCELKITPEGNIRKVSSSVGYNGRLIIQAKKQDDFDGSLGISVPKVLSISTESDLYSFDMEYIRADTFSKFLFHEDFTTVRMEFERILLFIKQSIKHEDYVDVTEEIYKKTASLTINMDANIRSFLRKIESTKLIAPKGYCHGDLTFENILIAKDMYFIDFLDSFIETPLIDMAKISQELNVYWSYRNASKINGSIVSKMCGLNNLFMCMVDELGLEFKKTYRYLEILNLMRILPYTHDVRTYMLLKRAINKLNQLL